MHLLRILLLSLGLLLKCACANLKEPFGSVQPSPSTVLSSPAVPKPTPPKSPAQGLEQLIKEGKVKITRDGSLEVISVFGPNQYQTTGTYDCWIHSPFNAWRLFEGDSIASFAGKNWETSLVKEIAKFKQEQGYTQSTRKTESFCLTEAAILKPMVSSPDFTKIDIRGDFLAVGGEGRHPHSLLNAFLKDDLAKLTKADYAYFSADHKGIEDNAMLSYYVRDCFSALGPMTSFNENLLTKFRCIDALKKKLEHNIYTDDRLRTTIDDFLASYNLSLETLTKIDAYNTYSPLIKEFGDKIKRIRKGHNQILTLGFQSPNEYPLNHSVAAKIAAPNADTIIVVNSENRHVGVNKTLKMLHQIFKLPLPEELP